jgi:hypothetical protein
MEVRAVVVLDDQGRARCRPFQQARPPGRRHHRPGRELVPRTGQDGAAASFPQYADDQSLAVDRYRYRLQPVHLQPVHLQQVPVHRITGILDGDAVMPGRGQGARGDRQRLRSPGDHHDAVGWRHRGPHPAQMRGELLTQPRHTPGTGIAELGGRQIPDHLCERPGRLRTREQGQVRAGRPQVQLGPPQPPGIPVRAEPGRVRHRRPHCAGDDSRRPWPGHQEPLGHQLRVGVDDDPA